MVQFTFFSIGLRCAQIFIVTVPLRLMMPIVLLVPLINASQVVGMALKKGDNVINESTVYPGCTEEVCVPVLEKSSDLKFNVNFLRL